LSVFACGHTPIAPAAKGGAQPCAFMPFMVKMGYLLPEQEMAGRR